MALGDYVANIGHALGLPEMGISEALGGIDTREYKANTTTNTTVNPPSGPSYQTYTPAGGTINGTLQNRGTTANVANTPQATMSTAGNSREASYRAAGGQGDVPVGWNGPASAPNNDEINRAIEETYGASENYLNQAENQVRSDYPTVQNDINAQYGVNTAQLGTGHQNNVNTLNQTQDKTDYAHESALAAARRLYSELRQGYQQRFGGSSSAGQAASEIANVEQQRQMGQTNRGYQDANVQIGNSRMNEEKEYQNGLQALNVQKDTALNQANRDFQNKLLQISQNRAANAQAKGQAKLQALQDLRNQIFQINQQTVQFAQSLEAMRAQGQAQLGNFGTSTGQYVANAQQAAQGFGQYASQKPTSNLQASGGGQQQAQPSYIGAITPNKRPEYPYA